MSSEIPARAVSIVVVTYNSERVIAGALDAMPAGCQVICVDNGSADKTVEIASRYPVEILTGGNRGYGTACNAGARAASGEFVLMMNPDVILKADTIANLLSAAERYESDVFFPLVEDAGGRITFRDYNRIEGRRNRPRKLGRAGPVGDCCTRFVEGSIFMIRRSLFEQIGGFDPKIFLYYEDDDLSIRLLEQKKPMVLVFAARATHLVSASSPPTFDDIARRSAAKKISQYYIREKYNLARHPWIDGIFQCANLARSVVAVDRVGLAFAWGRLKGITHVIRARPS